MKEEKKQKILETAGLNPTAEYTDKQLEKVAKFLGVKWDGRSY